MSYGCAISDARCKASYKPKHKIVTESPTDVPKQLSKEEREEHLKKLRKKKEMSFFIKGPLQLYLKIVDICEIHISFTWL